MTHKIHFHKMHGAGNDYIYVNTMKFPIAHPEKAAIQWSAYHTGIGSDGLVLIGKSDKADFSMRIFNADGSEAMMCGNASRCIGKYVYEQGLTTNSTITLDTLSGIKTLQLHIDNGTVGTVTVDMGEPKVIEKSTNIEIKGKKYIGSIISMGNPHFVIFVDDVEHLDVSTIGPMIENHPLFPDRTNVEFAQVLADDKIRMRVWERGSGITMACGTGACATLVAGVATQRIGSRSTIQMDGGKLLIEWDEHANKVLMTGEAVMVYEGDITLEEE